jgi:hypothetical protein
MRRLSLFVCGFALLSAAPICAQHTILPTQFRSWVQFKCANGGLAPVLANETGQQASERCTYSSGDNWIGITLGRYRDPSSAYEVYTSLLKSGEMPTNLGQVAAFDKDGVVIQYGTFVIASTSNISKDDLGALVKAVEASSEKGPLPPVRTYLPKMGRLLGTERYALGPEAMRAALGEFGQSDMAVLVDAAGFSSGAEAMLARYSSPAKGSGVLLLLEYPTPQLAEQHIHHLDEVIPAAAKQAGTEIERKGSLLKMVLSPNSVEYAKSLREAVDYETQVTWNEAGQAATDPPITSTLVKIIMGTGVFMVAALVLGVAFGGVRVVTKRFFPGKVFDRPNQMEVLQLGLSGKRIDPTDFY